MNRELPSRTYRSEKAKRLARYLRQESERTSGDLYVKGESIADDVGLSPKEIGTLMIQIQDSVPELTIQRWSYTSATTWRVTTT